MQTQTTTIPMPHAAGGAPALSTQPAGIGEGRLALTVVLVLTLLFATTVPFARTPLAAVWAFIPAYQSAVVVVDVLTAVLLYGLFATTRSNGLLVLAAGYLFTAFMAIAHALSFPGLLAPGGIIGGGGQTTAWLYFLWHGMFPLLVLASVGVERGTTGAMSAAVPRRKSTVNLILGSLGVALAASVALTLAATWGHAALPVIMSGNSDLPAKYLVAWGTCLLCALAAFALWRKAPRTKLDLWLMVVMLAWVFDVALAAVFNAGRFSLGFYAGRVYGLLASSFVLIVLLVENARAHASLLEAQANEKRLAQEALARQAERLRLLHDIDTATVAEKAPQAIAEAVIRPLRELLGVPRAIVNMFDLEAGEVEWLAASGRHRTRVGPGVRYSIRLMGDLAALRRGEPQVVDTFGLPPGPDVDALLASGVRSFMVVPMIAGGQLIGALSFGGERAVFSIEQMSIAREMATQLAVAISQASLLERVRGQAGDLERSVAERTAELAAANRDLESFSLSVSHDLRAPLRAVDGYALMLEEDYGGVLDDEGRRLLGAVRASASKMAQLINDLLRFSQLGRKPLSVSPFDMKALVQEVVTELAPSYPAARIQIGPLPQYEGDRALLRQVWANLVGNALKYSSRKDRPEVEIGGREENGDTVFWVRDNGAGFDMRYSENLFKVFQRLHGADEFEGTGVGLAIVHRVVSKHGGRVWAEGGVGKGATFRFSFPVREKEAATAVA
jgi:signal transduction histidine kinase